MPIPIPRGRHAVTPYLTPDNAAEAVAFYKRVFGAKERVRIPGPGGKVGHAELEIGDSVVMVTDVFPQSATKSPRDLGGTTGGLIVYVDDVDAVVRQALEAGATLALEVEDRYWGDRYGSVIDPFGHVWSIATRIEDVPAEEVLRRAEQAVAAASG